MNFAVLGAGDVGLACALALGASGVSGVTVWNRDGTLRQAQEGILRAVDKNACSGDVAALLPYGVRLGAYTPTVAGEPSATAAPVGAAAEAVAGAFLCTPTLALQGVAAGEGPIQPAVRYLHSCTFSEAQGHLPFIACLSRGFGAEGETAAELVARALAARPSGPVLPIFTATGPLVPREWLQQSLRRPSAAVDSGSGTSPDGELGAASDSRPMLTGTAISFALAGVATPAGATSSSSSSRGATHSSTDSAVPPLFAGDQAFHQEMEHLFKEVLFTRESVTYERDPGAGAALGLVNGCLPLCAFGAGLVSNAYAGSSVSALGAYAQHCASATTALVNALLPGRSPGAPLPMGAYAAIFSACHLHSAREFILGRRMDFNFRQLDAVKAVYPGRTHEVFAACVDGLHTRMKVAQVSSPFFEVLMDTFGTVARASTAGQGLVREGDYSYREAPSSPLLEHVRRIDAAMLSGDEARFKEAKRALEEAFAYYPVRKS